MATETTVIRTTRRRYHWPELQLNVWLLVMLAAASTVLGMFAWFLQVQKQLEVGAPWLFTFGIVVSVMTLLFIALILTLAANRVLVPGIILLGSFILFVLWLTALIETSIQLYGPQANVNANCNAYVTGQEYHGVSVETLAWLTQSNICSCWRAIFAWEIVAVVLFFWMMVLSWQVNVDED